MTSERTNSLLYVVLGLGAIAALITLVLMFGQQSSGVMAASLGPIPAAPLYELDTVTGKPNMMTVETAPGLALPVIDRIDGEDGTTYYLLLNGTLESQVFMHTQEGMQMITESPSLKFGLVRDRESGRFAFLSSKAGSLDELTATSTVAVTTFFNGTENVIGTASAVAILEGGEEILVQDADSLYIMPIAGGTKRAVLDGVAAGRVWAYDSESNLLALYNATTTAVDLFTLPAGSYASYQRSIPVSAPPQTLVFDDSELLALTVGQGDRPVLTISKLEGGRTRTFPVWGAYPYVKAWRFYHN